MTTAVATPTRMRTPEYSAAAAGVAPRDGQHFENEYFQYLKPESFTVLPPDVNAQAPSPPRAPEPYKLTPRKRHKNQAFSIIAEPGLSAPSSRAGSPTGRVSPFRGRGFNPFGSRHASPAPSPPPGQLLDDDAILQQSRELQLQLKKSSIGRSQIPILKSSMSRERRSSAEDILSPETSPPEGLSPTRSNLQSNARYSKSMINIAPKNLSKKPPPSPRRTSNLKQSFVRLSPIIGSSPEAGSDHMSSPSKIPRSRSQPPSRLTSPNGTTSRILSPSESRGPSRPPSRGPSRPASRNGSRSTSREPSPGRSPSKIPMKSSAYKNIPAKVDTFSRVITSSKPKVPQKPKVYSTRSSNLDRSRPSSIRKNVNKSQIGSNKSPRRDLDDTETTDTDRETVRSNTRSSINSTSRRNSINKPSTSGYSKQSRSSKYDGEKPSTSRGGYNNKTTTDSYDRGGYSNNKITTDSYDRSSTTSTVAGGKGESNYTSKSSVKRSDSRSNLHGTGSKTNSQTFRKDGTGAKDSRSRRNDTTTATSTTEDLSKSDDDDTTEDARDDDILSVTIDEIIGSQTTKIVSATAETVVKPLNIEAKLIKQSEANSMNQSESSGNYNSNTSSNQRAGTNSMNSSSNQRAGTNTSTNSSSNQRAGTNTSSNTSSNQRAGTNTSLNSTSNQRANANTTSNSSSNQRTTTEPTTTHSSNKPTSNSNQNSNDQTLSNSNNNPVSNLTTPANGSVINTPTSNPSNNLTVSDSNQNPSSVSPSVTAANNQMESVNNNLKHVSNSVNNSLEMNVKNNFNNLTPPDSDKVSSKSLMDSSPLTNSGKPKQARTVIVDEIKPIKITVREKSGDIEVQSGNYALPRSATNGIAERPLLPPNNHPQNPSESPPADVASKPGPCSKIFACCKKKKTDAPVTTADGSTVSGVHSLGSVAPDVGAAEGEKAPKCWDKICCKSRGGKVGDVNKSKFSCFPKLKRGKDDENWVDRRDSILSEPPKKQPFSMTLRKIFCTPCAKCKKKPEESVSRRTSMMSKKKSLSSTMQPPPEDTGPKLDTSLVEHASHMRGAIPVLPVPLAWICLICNVFVPGFGTILSGLFCLCIGIPRFSPRDSAKARVGAFLIDVIVGISQAFTVLFCLVGWGWSIWWGVIMLKVARKYRKIERLEKNAIEETAVQLPSVNVNHAQRDVESGS